MRTKHNKAYARKLLRVGYDYAWRSYADFIQQHPYLRMVFLRARKWRCENCMCDLTKLPQRQIILHHKRYDHYCRKDYVKPPEYNPKDPTYPDCQSCSKKHRKWFKECRNNLALVCSACNGKLNHRGKSSPSSVNFNYED